MIDLDYEKIKKKFPKSFKLFMIFLIKKYPNLKPPEEYLLDMTREVAMTNDNTICYCDFELFFDSEFGFKISIYLHAGIWKGDIKKAIKGNVNPKYKYRFVASFQGNENKDDIKIRSVYGCFQMAEKILEAKCK
jgi:hypothetical protein